MIISTDWLILGITLIDKTNLRKAGKPRFLLGEIKYARFIYNQTSNGQRIKRITRRTTS